MKEIYEVTAGARPTQLVRKYDVGDEVLSIANPDLLPDAPNVVTVYDPTGSFVTVKYTGKVNNSLTGCTYCEGVLSHTFEAVNSFAVRTIAQYDFDAITEHVSLVEESYIDGAVIDGEELPIADKKVVIPVSSDGVLGVVKPGANITVDDDGTINASGTISIDYNNALNKPQINGVELVGNVTYDQLGYATETSAGTVKVGNNLSIREDGTLDAADPGPTDYGDLINKPKINGVELNGDVSLDSFGYATETTAGTVKVGDHLSIDDDGTLNAIATTDYTELSNKPTINGVTLEEGITYVDLGIATDAKIGVVKGSDELTINQYGELSLVDDRLKLPTGASQEKINSESNIVGTDSTSVGVRSDNGKVSITPTGVTASDSSYTTVYSKHQIAHRFGGVETVYSFLRNTVNSILRKDDVKGGANINVVKNVDGTITISASGSLAGIKGVMYHGELLPPDSDGVVTIPADIRSTLVGEGEPDPDEGTVGDLYFKE